MAREDEVGYFQQLKTEKLMEEFTEIYRKLVQQHELILKRINEQATTPSQANAYANAFEKVRNEVFKIGAERPIPGGASIAQLVAGAPVSSLKRKYPTGLVLKAQMISPTQGVRIQKNSSKSKKSNKKGTKRKRSKSKKRTSITPSKRTEALPQRLEKPKNHSKKKPLIVPKNLVGSFSTLLSNDGMMAGENVDDLHLQLDDIDKGARDTMAGRGYNKADDEKDRIELGDTDDEIEEDLWQPPPKRRKLSRNEQRLTQAERDAKEKVRWLYVTFCARL